MASLSREHRRAQLAIRAGALRDLLKLWPSVDLARIPQTWPPFEAAALLIVRKYGRVSAGVAHAYYAASRRSMGAPGTAPTLRATPTDEQIIGGLKVMGPFNAARQLALGRRMDDVRMTTLVNLSGVVSKYTLDHGRDVLLNAVMDDPVARGWQRVAGATACNFCTMLAGRGAVYKSEATAGFQSHRHCACSAEPVW